MILHIKSLVLIRSDFLLLKELYGRKEIYTDDATVFRG